MSTPPGSVVDVDARARRARRIGRRPRCRAARSRRDRRRDVRGRVPAASSAPSTSTVCSARPTARRRIRRPAARGRACTRQRASTSSDTATPTPGRGEQRVDAVDLDHCRRRDTRGRRDRRALRAEPHDVFAGVDHAHRCVELRRRARAPRGRGRRELAAERATVGERRCGLAAGRAPRRVGLEVRRARPTVASRTPPADDDPAARTAAAASTVVRRPCTLPARCARFEQRRRRRPSAYPPRHASRRRSGRRGTATATSASRGAVSSANPASPERHLDPDASAARRLPAPPAARRVADRPGLADFCAFPVGARILHKVGDGRGFVDGLPAGAPAQVRGEGAVDDRATGRPLAGAQRAHR